jgi:hypothetical protein
MILWSMSWLSGRPLPHCLTALIVGTVCNITVIAAAAVAVKYVRG